jgi:methylthioribose-1-phosphate isomerase
MGPAGVCAANPAFDITPAKYVSAIITERGVIEPPYLTGIKKMLENC